MNTNYFTNQKLSDKLRQLGVESQFDFVWIDNGRDKVFLDIRSRVQDRIDLMAVDIPKMNKAYHWSDLCMWDNSFKIFGNKTSDAFSNSPAFEMKPHRILSLVMENKDWQTFLEAEVDQALKQSNKEI